MQWNAIQVIKRKKLRTVLRIALFLTCIIFLYTYILPIILDRIVISQLAKAALFHTPIKYQRISSNSLVAHELTYHETFANGTTVDIKIPMMVIQYSLKSLRNKRLLQVLVPRMTVNFDIIHSDLNANKLALMVQQLRVLYLIPPSQQISIESIQIHMDDHRSNRTDDLTAQGRLHITAAHKHYYRARLELQSEGEMKGNIDLQSTIKTGGKILQFHLDDSSVAELSALKLQQQVLSVVVHPKKIQLKLDISKPNKTPLLADASVKIEKVKQEFVEQNLQLNKVNLGIKGYWIPEDEFFHGEGHLNSEKFFVNNKKQSNILNVRDLVLDFSSASFNRGIWNASGQCDFTLSQAADPVLSHFPLRMTSEFTIENNLIKAYGKIKDWKNIFSGDIRLEHNLDKKSGDGNIHLSSGNFNEKPPNFKQVMEQYDPELFFDYGTISLGGSFQWHKNQQKWIATPDKYFSIDIKDLSGTFKASKFEKLTAEINLKSIIPFETNHNQRLVIKSFYNRVKFDNIEVLFRLVKSDNLELHVKEMSAVFAGGNLATGKFAITKTHSITPVNLTLTNIQLEELFKLVNIDGLSAEGRINGLLPLTYNDKGYIIRHGTVTGAGSGTIHYEPKELTDSFEDPKKAAIVTQVLSNFKYKEFHVSLDMLPEQSYLHGVISGTNPDFYNGAIPLKFRLNLTAPFETMLDAGFIGKYVYDRYNYTVTEE